MIRCHIKHPKPKGNDLFFVLLCFSLAIWITPAHNSSPFELLSCLIVWFEVSYFNMYADCSILNMMVSIKMCTFSNHSTQYSAIVFPTRNSFPVQMRKFTAKKNNLIKRFNNPNSKMCSFLISLSSSSSNDRISGATSSSHIHKLYVWSHF